MSELDNVGPKNPNWGGVTPEEREALATFDEAIFLAEVERRAGATKRAILSVLDADNRTVGERTWLYGCLRRILLETP